MRKRLGRATTLVRTGEPPVPAGRPLVERIFAAAVAEKNETLEALLGALRNSAALEGERDEFMARLCLDEALTNAVMHGSRYDSSKRVRARVFLGDGRWQVLIEDQGAGFREEDLPDPDAPENLLEESGRGVTLMRRFMHAVSYWRGGSALLMARALPAVAAPTKGAARRPRKSTPAALRSKERRR